MAILNHGSTLRTADGGQTTTTIVTAANIGTYGVAANSTYYIGTTQNIFNRASGAQTLTGVSIDGNAANITAYTINQNVGTANAPTFAGITSTSTIVVSDNTAVNFGSISQIYHNSARAATQFTGTSGSDTMCIKDASGYVGIGTTNPAQKLHVVGIAYSDTDFRAPTFYDSNDTAYYVNPNSSSNLSILRVFSAFDTASSDVYANMRVINDTAFSDGMYIGYANAGSGVTRLFGGGATSGALIKYSDYTVESNSFRAPIFYDSDNTAYYLDAANSTTSLLVAGKVGIGTTSPANKLDVVSATANNGSPFAASFFSGDDSSASWRCAVNLQHNANTTIVIGSSVGLSFAPLSSTSSSFYGSAAIKAVRPNITANNQDTDLAFWTRTGASNSTVDTEKVRITGTGNVGIGIAAPDAKLHIYHSGQPQVSDGLYASMILDTDSTSNYQRIRYDVGATPYWGLGREGSTNDFILSGRISSTFSDNVFRIQQSTGNVGIGVASPSQKLDVSGAINASTYVYAGVFYDNDNTVYYTNPSGTSNLVGLTVANTITGSVSGNAATATNVAWTGITGGARTNYLLEFQPPANSYAGFAFKTSAAGEAGYFLVKGTADGDVYTAEGITLVADAGWLTLAQRTTASRGVKIMTGTTSLDRFKITTAGDVQIVNGNTFTYNSNVVLHAGNYGGYSIFSGIVSSAVGGFQTATYAAGRNRIWSFGNSDGYGLAYFQGSGGVGGYDIIGMHFGTATAAASQYQFNAIGSFTASGDVRAPIFYDSANTTYYLDPANTGTSLLVAGNVGIGTTSPAALLNIRASAPTSTGTVTTGTNLLIDSNTSNYITFRNTADNGTYAGLVFLDNNVGGYITFRNYTASGVAVGSDCMIYGSYQDHIFQSGSSEVINGKTETMRIQQNGNVGINTISPAYKLDVSGTGRFTGDLTVTNILGSSNSATLYPNTGSYGSWKIGGTRNGWYGIEFESSSNLMMNSNEVGFHRNGHGWQLWWSAGTAYCMKGNPGGGTQATILDSSNQSYAWAMNQNVTTGSSPTFVTVTGTAINIAGNGAGYDTYGTIGVTEPANASNYSYYGLTRQSNIGAGFGLTGTTGALGLGANAFWFGGATSTAAGVMSTAYIAFNGSNLVAVGTADATQFRDKDNTAYYINPAGNSIVSSLTFDSNITIYKHNDRNLLIQGGGGTDAGLLGRGSSGQFAFQVYGNSGSYGFLDGAWAGWDIRKVVDGDLFLNDNNTYYLNPGSTTNLNNLTVAGDVRSPIFYDSNNTAYYLDPANSGTSLLVAGKVGIGTVSPIGLLEVRGANRLISNDGLLQVNSNNNAGIDLGGSISFGGVYASASVTEWAQLSGRKETATSGEYGGYLDFATRPHLGLNTSRIRITSTGNVGIGTTSPTGKLHVYNSAATDTTLESGTSGTTGKLIFKTSDNADLNKYIMQESFYMILNGHANEGFKFRDSASNVLLSIFGAANAYASRVGIGTQTPAQKLHVSGIGYSDTDFRAPIFYDSANTGYYLDPAGTSNLNALVLSGASYFRPQTWIQMDGSYGMYWPNTNGCHIEGNTLSTYGSLAIRGTRGGWKGIHFYEGGNVPHLMFDGSANGGVYFETGGRWASYYSYSNNCWGFATSTTNSAYNLYVPTGVYSGGRVDGTIFYDSNNTTYYLDPANSGTSLLVAGKVGIGTTSPTYKLQIGTVGSLDDSIRIGTYQVAKNTRQYIGNTRDDSGLFESAGNGDTPSTVLGGVAGIRIVNTEGTLYAPQADNSVQLLTHIYNGGSRVALHANYNGNVGIGTTSPSQTLHVVGTGFASSDFRSPIFYDSNDTGYYLDPAGTSNLNKLSAFTMSYNDMNSMHVNSPYVARYNASALYRNGTMGYGTVDCNVIFSNWGSGFIDTWGSPANAPGNSTHYVGFQGFHYNHQDNSQAYGFQMLCAGEANNRFFWRSAWPTLRSWVEMIHSGNYNSFSPTLTGTGANGSWGISVTGSSASCTGNAATVTTNANLTGHITSVGNATSLGSFTSAQLLAALTDETGTGANVFATSPTLVSPILGTPTSGNLANCTFPTLNQNTTGSSASCTGNSVTATSATFLNASNYIQRIGGSGNYNTDFQNTPAGSVRHQGDDASSTNNPGAAWWFVDNYRHSNSSNYWGTQIAWGWEDNANRLATRNVTGGVFGSWVYYLNSANYSSYAIARGGDTLDGVTLFRSNKGATSTVGANNTYGLQAYSSDAGAAGMSFHRGGHYAINMGLDPDNVFRIGGWSASSNRLQLDTGGNLTVATNMYANGFYDNNNTALYCDPNGTSLFTGLTVTNTITGSITGNAGGSSASCSGNAATATVLQTARTIGGVSFNGSANINLPGVNTAGNQNTTGTSSNITAYTINQNVGTANTPKFLNVYGERATVTSASSTTVNTQYNVTELTMSAFISTLTFSNIQASGIVHMWTIVTLGNGSATSVTWPAAIKWPGGTAPNITGTNTKRDIYQFVTYDGGTNIYAIIVGQNL